MEFANVEIIAVEKVMTDKAVAEVRELIELELVMVGGGQGDIHLG